MPPRTARHPRTIVQHGQTRVDPYHWLRDENWQQFIRGNLEFANPDIRTYLESEADYTREQMAGTSDLQDRLHEEFLDRIQEDDETCPYQINDYFYYRETRKGLDYPRLCRKKGGPDGERELYLDVNEMARGKDLFILDDTSPNESNLLFAYTSNETGSMERTLKVRRFGEGEDFPWEIGDTTGSFLWEDDAYLLYVERGPHSRGQKVFRVNVYDGPDARELLYEKPEELDDMFLHLSRTTDRKFHLLHLSSGASSQLYVKEGRGDSFGLFAVGENDVHYDLEHSDGFFYIHTNLNGANNYQVYRCPDTDFSVEAWELYIAEQSDRYISEFSIHGRFMVLVEKNTEKALPEITLFNMDSRERRLVAIADEAYSLQYLGAHAFNASEVRIRYQSPRQPPQDMDIHLETAETAVLKTRTVPGFEPERYQVSREFARGHDGELVPLTLIHLKNHPRDGSAPAFVYGYGSYGHGLPAGFSSHLFSLVDRGFVFALAHIRGGDDRGYGWYLQGKLRRKMNTFLDFISCCEHLIGRRYTGLGKITASGGSAGGMLVAAVANMRPDLFSCVVADVPFVDVVNTISDPTLPLTPPEWEEWGNPIESAEDFTYMMRYSPYDNVEAKGYPAMLFTSGISDEQVTYWEPAKMVAKLRATRTDDNLLLLRIKMHAGHAGASKRYEALRDRAFSYAFVLRCAGLKS